MSTYTDRVLRRGADGPAVAQMQALLQRAGIDIAADSVFGPATAAAVRSYQRDHCLVADGIVGTKTWAALIGQPLPKPLSHADIEHAAHDLGVETAVVLAVNEIESRGEGFIRGTDEPAILYERHIMYRRLKAGGWDVATLSEQHSNLVSIHTGGYSGGLAEYDRLNAARRISRDDANASTSWGAFQVMGFHAIRLGYDSVTGFVAAMHESEAAQLDAFVRFVQADHALVVALQNHDWAAFARGYNGPAYASHNYDGRMKSAYVTHSEAEAEHAQAA